MKLTLRYSKAIVIKGATKIKEANPISLEVFNPPAKINASATVPNTVERRYPAARERKPPNAERKRRWRQPVSRQILLPKVSFASTILKTFFFPVCVWNAVSVVGEGVAVVGCWCW